MTRPPQNRLQRAPASAAETARPPLSPQRSKRGKMLPVSVFVSLKKLGRLMGARAKPVFDVPVTISNPETPIGTYVFTAVDYTDGGNGVRWMATALPPSRGR